MLDTEKKNSMTRKEYLKFKKKSKSRLPWLKNIALILVIAGLSIYIVNELKIYNSVTEMTNKMVEESKLIKTYKIYFMGKPYTSEDKSNFLYFYQGSDESRVELKSGKGLEKIFFSEDGYIYGIKDKSLIKVDVKRDMAEVIAKDNVSDYVLANKNIFLYKDYGSKSEKTGVYNLSGQKIITGTIYQMLADSKRIYVVTPDATSKSLLSFSLDGKAKKLLSNKDIVTNIIQDEEYIYYSTTSKQSRICRVSKEGGEILTISSTQVLDCSSRLNGDSVMCSYNGGIIYINSKDKKVHYIENSKDKVLVDNEVKLIQLRENILYFALKNKIDIYRYNMEKNKLEKITSARSDEMICIN